jgi:hypothetical protein
LQVVAWQTKIFFAFPCDMPAPGARDRDLRSAVKKNQNYCNIGQRIAVKPF